MASVPGLAPNQYSYTLALKTSSVDEMRAIDPAAIERFGISADLLVGNAGGAA